MLSSPYLINSILHCCWMSERLEDRISEYFFLASISFCNNSPFVGSCYRISYKLVRSLLALSVWALALSVWALKSAKCCIFSLLSSGLILLMYLLTWSILQDAAAGGRLEVTMWTNSLCLHYISQNWNLALGFVDEGNLTTTGVWSDNPFGK